MPPCYNNVLPHQRKPHLLSAGYGMKLMNYGFNVDFLSNKYGDFSSFSAVPSPGEAYLSPSPFISLRIVPTKSKILVRKWSAGLVLTSFLSLSSLSPSLSLHRWVTSCSSNSRMPKKKELVQFGQSRHT